MFDLLPFKKGGRLQQIWKERESRMEQTKNKIDLFLDSGAFSAFTQGIKIDIQKYITFIKKYEKFIHVYANLDVIGDAKATWKNQMIMEDAGLHPLPVFHTSREDPKWLQRYLNRGYDYIALGGMAAGETRGQLTKLLDPLFSKYLCGVDGMPVIKVHGFGLTSLKLMFRYPWYSVDSTTWVIAGRLGSVFIPRMRDGKYIHNEAGWKIGVSERSPSKKDAGKHLSTFSPKVREVILNYFKHKGYALGKSQFRKELEDYKLKDKERWFGKAKNGQREIELIIEPGLCNDYRLRDELNIIYFLDLQKIIPEWPWPFKIKKQGLF